MTLEQSLECNEEASQGRVRMEEQRVQKPEDGSGLGHFRTGGRRWARREGRGWAGPGHAGLHGLGRELDLVLLGWEASRGFG